MQKTLKVDSLSVREAFPAHLVSTCLALLLAVAVSAQAEEEVETGAQTENLAKTAQNPIGNMISLPFQNNMNFGVGPDDRVQDVLNIQPVIPFSLGDDWNLITRSILPVISQPAPGDDRTDGIGDLNVTGFFSPSAPGDLIWGVGPVLVFPTASDDVLGAEKYSAGVSVVGLTMPGNWVVGGLVSNVWSYAGDDDREDVNAFLFQYFINYNFASGWYLTSAPIMTADWEAPSSDRWTVPLGGGVGKIVRFGKQPVNINSQIFYNVEKPRGGPDWQWRFQFQLMFPK
jgi:hypothetical protein